MKRKAKYPYAVYMTAFHGGFFVSRHATRAAAESVVRRLGSRDCLCGCAGVIDETRGEKPGTRRDQDNWSNPYAIGCVD